MNFQEAEHHFQALEQRWTAGQISAEHYQSALARLRVVDAAGQTWMLQEHSGRWFVFRGGQWVAAEKPQAPAPPAAAAAPPPLPRRPVRQQPAGPPPSGGRKGWAVWAVAGLLGACLVCGVLSAAAGYLVYSGQWSLPQAIAPGLPEITAPGDSPAPQTAGKVLEVVAAAPDGAPHADAYGVALLVPPAALEEGGQVNLTAADLRGPWRAAVEQGMSIDTPFYSLSAAGKHDSTGSLSLSFPAPNPGARLLAVVDGEFLVELAQQPQDGQITLQTRAGPEDAAELAPPPGYDGTGSIVYALISPKAGSRAPDEGSVQLAAHRAEAQADERNCIPDISIIGGAAINLCRQNAAGTVQVMLPTTQRSLLPQVDLMVDRIEAVMGKYYNLGFTTAQLSHSAPMLVRVSTKVTSPSYYPLNGVLYIPVDSVSRIASVSPTDVYHEMAHWIQAVKYSTRLAYYSGERTWWLETSAENMVMLVEPAYVGSNLTTYGTISTGDNRLALQAEPYQWPGDYYVQAQLLKVNLCDSSACPLSPSSFAKAISEGSYPLMSGALKAQVSANLKDYAYYLLGKAPTTANGAIPLTGAVRSGEGYGEYIRITRNSNVDLKYDTNGVEPQVRKESVGGLETLVVEARLDRDGVYPLAVLGGGGNNPGLPVEMLISPGAPFYYTLDDGAFQYSDGSQELKIQPIHGKMGIKKVRIVAVGESGGEVFKARVQPLSLAGAWVVMASGPKSAGGMTCSGDPESIDNPDGTGQLMAYLLALVSGMGDMQADPSGRSLDWVEVGSRVPADFAKEEYTFKASALLAGDAIKYQGLIDIPKSEASLPPAAPVAAAALCLPLAWWGRKKLDPKSLRVLANGLAIGFVVLVSSGCFGMGMYGSANLDAQFQKIEYVGGKDTGVMTASPDASGLPAGQPLWKLSGSGTYAVTFLIDTTVTDVDGNETTETTTCTGSVTYPVSAWIYQDFSVVIPSD